MVFMKLCAECAVCYAGMLVSPDRGPGHLLKHKTRSQFLLFDFGILMHTLKRGPLRVFS